MTDTSVLSERILTFIKEEILLDDTQAISGSDDLLRTDILDSLAVMRLVEFLHSDLGHSVPPEDITLTHFASVDAICTYLTSDA